MRYTIPQRLFLESDVRLRELEREALGSPEGKYRYLVELARSGLIPVFSKGDGDEISVLEIDAAAALGDEVAKKVAEYLGEVSPVVDNVGDFINMFITGWGDVRRIYDALYKYFIDVDQTIVQQLQLESGRDRFGFLDEYSVVAYRICQLAIDKVGLDEFLDIVRPLFVRKDIFMDNLRF